MSAGGYLAQAYGVDYWPPEEEFDGLLLDVNKVMGQRPVVAMTKRVLPKKIGGKAARVVRFG